MSRPLDDALLTALGAPVVLPSRYPCPKCGRRLTTVLDNPIRHECDNMLCGRKQVVV